MGVAITEILKKNEIELRDLANKVIAIDAPLFLYQFLATIRSQDGTPLTDKKGNITSHLAGLFFRTTNLMQKKLKLVYVFDGKSPELKKKEQDRRRKLKEEAMVKYKEAVKSEDVTAMKKYAQRTSKLTPEMISEAKEMLDALGVPYVDAPSEAEAQASYMVSKGDCFAVATQDADTLMFGTPRLLKNLSLAGRRKRGSKLAFDTYKPEMIFLSENLNELGLDIDQLIVLCMIVGTDFNVGGIKGLGPKKALKLVKEQGHDYDKVFEIAKWDHFFDFSWKDVYDLIKNIPTTDEYELKWKTINAEKVMDILVSRHDFMEERIAATLKKFEKEMNGAQQKGLGDFF